MPANIDYMGQQTTFLTGKKNKFSIPRAITERGFVLKNNINNPGPGHYTSDPLNFKKKSSNPVFGRQKRKIFDLKGDVPGVGEYDVKGLGFFKVKKNKFSIGRSKRFKPIHVKLIRDIQERIFRLSFTTRITKRCVIFILLIC